MLIYLSTKSRVKAKSMTKAEKVEYDNWCKSVGITGSKKMTKVLKTGQYIPPKIYRRETANIPSRDSGIGFASKKEVNVYTGDKVMGISIVHKSCLQPVFTNDQAKDFANMRR